MSMCHICVPVDFLFCTGFSCTVDYIYILLYLCEKIDVCYKEGIIGGLAMLDRKERWYFLGMCESE